jgi:hypothetical protein
MAAKQPTGHDLLRDPPLNKGWRDPAWQPPRIDVGGVCRAWHRAPFVRAELARVTADRMASSMASPTGFEPVLPP